MLRAFQVLERPHGTRKQRQRASGRKAKGHGLILPMRERVLYTEAVRRDSFHAWVKQFFASKPLQESIKVFCKPRPRKGGFTCIFGCLTHERCRWQGTAQLETDAAGDTYYVVLRHAEESVHSRKDRVIANTLTWLQRQVIFRSRSSLTRQAQNALKKLKRRTPDGPQQVTPPQAQKLDGFMERFRRQMRQPQFEPGARQMDASVFQYCIDCANASLGGPSQVAPDDARIRCDDPRIRVLSPCLTPTELTMPLLCPALVRDVLDLLPQPWRLHLSLDGTYRLLLFKRYVLLNVGVNVKHWTGSKKPADVGPAFRTRYIPMAFAIAHVEASASYSSMVLCLLTLCRAAASLQGRAFTDKQITQWHGDLHKGLDKARAKVAPSSVRLSDWAHCCGVTSPGPSGFPALAARSGRRPTASTPGAMVPPLSLCTSNDLPLCVAILLYRPPTKFAYVTASRLFFHGWRRLLVGPLAGSAGPCSPWFCDWVCSPGELAWKDPQASCQHDNASRAHGDVADRDCRAAVGRACRDETASRILSRLARGWSTA